MTSPGRAGESSYSESNGGCVEVAFLDGGMVGVRDSKNPIAPALVFTSGEWAAFTAGVVDREFDAAQLTKAGVPVTLIARDESLRQIREHGIVLEDACGERETIRPDHVLAAEDVDHRADLVLFCVKSYDTEAATESVRLLVKPDGHVLCLQNGVQNEQILADKLGPSHILSGVLYIGANRLGPGVIRCSAPPSLIVGPYVGADLAVSSEVQELFSSANIKAAVEPDVGASKWQKFLLNCGLNPLTAITKKRLGELLSHPATADVFDMLVGEAAAVALAAGAPLAPDHKARVDDTAARMDISSSMAEDLAAGRKIELDAFTGYVIQLGETHGVPTPATRAAHGMRVALDNATAA
ncbi:2-dehydropantoate 2-reductase [Nocardia sp. NPDC049707]|uniref:2-dehydropantoate 2-reductase n=1 Tax=Nocardia sp. NPDC049707 TaxID=3154735 RepID=UPI0034444CD3